MGWTRDILGTFQEFFRTTGGVVVKNYSSMTSYASTGYMLIYSKGRKLFYKDESDTEKQVYSVSDIEEIAELENSLSELCWYYYSEPKYMSNFATDDFDDQVGIESLWSNYSYNASSLWVEPTLTGNVASFDISDLEDIERWDAKGDIVTWQSTEPDDTKGYFSSGGEGGSWPNVSKGCTVVYSGGTSDIVDYSGGGNQTDEVEVDTGIADETAIEAIYGSTVSGGNLTANSVTGSGTTLYDVDGIDPDNSNWITADSSIRIRIDKDDISGSSSTISVTVYGPYYSGVSMYIQKASIGPADGEGPSCTTTPTEITDFAGQEIAGADAETPLTSAPFAYDFTSSTHHIVTIDWDSSDGSVNESWSGGQNGTWWLKGSADTYDQASVSGFSEQPGNYILAGIEVSGAGTSYPATEAHTSTSSSLLELDTSSWTNIGQIIGVQSTPGSSTIYHAVSFNRGASDEKWRVYTTDWRDIAKLDSGTWKYQDASDDYQSADVNSRLHALSQAFTISANQMGVSVLQRVGYEEFGSVFSAGSLNFAWQVNANTGEIPTFDKYNIYYNSNPNLSLVTADWEVKSNDETFGFIVAKLKPIDSITVGTHVKAYISINNGIHWEETTLTTYKTDSNYTYVRGTIFGITARGDKTIRAKIRTFDMKNIKIVNLAVGLR
jgi:hypothetical protein